MRRECETSPLRSRGARKHPGGARHRMPCSWAAALGVLAVCVSPLLRTLAGVGEWSLPGVSCRCTSYTAGLGTTKRKYDSCQSVLPHPSMHVRCLRDRRASTLTRESAPPRTVTLPSGHTRAAPSKAGRRGVTAGRRIWSGCKVAGILLRYAFTSITDGDAASRTGMPSACHGLRKQRAHTC